MSAKDDRWRVWDSMPGYGQVLYQRAVGDAPEMESSKATAHRLGKILQKGDRLLDVGCGAGHYLKTLRREFPFPFHYTGIDATENYIALAKKAFAKDSDADFLVGDVEKLPVKDQAYDVVMCCNLFLHLPRIAPAIKELWRTAKRALLIRTLVGENSFRIKQVREWDASEDKKTPLFDDDGEPTRFHYFNIYSKKYVDWLCSQLPGAKSWTIEDDRDFRVDAMTAAKWPGKDKPKDMTIVVDGKQVNGSIIQPWAFIQITRQAA